MSNVIVGDNLIAAITGGVFCTTPLTRTVQGSDLLEISPSSIIAAYLIDEISKMTWPTDKSSWPLYISHMPDGDEVETDCGAIYDTSGILDGRLMSGLVPQHPGIQIKIRSRDYEEGYAKIEDVASALDAISYYSITIAAGEYEIQNVSRTTAVVFIGLEPGTKRRYLFTVNFLLTIKKLD
jgi:hypothetical protein